MVYPIPSLRNKIGSVKERLTAGRWIFDIIQNFGLSSNLLDDYDLNFYIDLVVIGYRDEALSMIEQICFSALMNQERG